MVIKETSVFTRQVLRLLTPEDYRALQLELATRPDAGPLIRGGGGLRKLRWFVRGRGKRGGIRMIYYWAVAQSQIVLLFMYPKSEQEDLTPEQAKVLRRIIETEYP